MIICTEEIDTLHELQATLHSKPLNILTPSIAMHKAEISSRLAYLLLFLQILIERSYITDSTNLFFFWTIKQKNQKKKRQHANMDGWYEWLNTQFTYGWSSLTRHWEKSDQQDIFIYTSYFFTERKFQLSNEHKPFCFFFPRKRTQIK